MELEWIQLLGVASSRLRIARVIAGLGLSQNVDELNGGSFETEHRLIFMYRPTKSTVSQALLPASYARLFKGSTRKIN